MLPENTDASYYSTIIPSIESKGLRIASALEISNKHHKAVVTTNGKKFYILFKKDKFGSLASQFKNEKQIGESINIESLYEAYDRNFDLILVADRDGRIYCMRPKEWLDYAQRNQTIRPVERKYFKKEYGKEIEVREVTASVRITEMVRWNP